MVCRIELLPSCKHELISEATVSESSDQAAAEALARFGLIKQIQDRHGVGRWRARVRLLTMVDCNRSHIDLSGCERHTNSISACCDRPTVFPHALSESRTILLP